MKVSIIIPTCKSSNLNPCLESILKYTDMTDKEIIIIANGHDDLSLKNRNTGNEVVIWHDEMIGYTKAVDEGIKAAKGEFIILLNDDTLILDSTKDIWIDTLLEPFKDEKMAITGPMKAYCPYAERDFLIFFCVCIRKSILDEIGIDPIFNPGYGEDSDFCAKIQDAGYKMKQVPVDSNQYSDDEHKRMIGNFPIYHEGNVTFKNWPGGEELLRKNRQVLSDRYASNISKALACDGYMSEPELKYLASVAKNSKVFIEVGSWHGRSSRAIGDNLPKGSVLYCVDTWKGSVIEQDTNHQSAKWMDGDHAYDEFLRNNIDLIQSGKIIPIRMSSKNAANLFKDKGIKADHIFIDAGHTYEDVKEDLSVWTSLCTDKLLGHDYINGMWPGVTRAVQERFKIIDNPYDTTIWVTTPEGDRSNIFDCFPFNNELDILERRFEELYDVVDRFIIVEATITHGNKPKPLNFNNNLKRFEKYLNKVTYLVADKFPATDSWSIERHQRDWIMKGLNDCKDTDTIMISDCDEIPNKEVVKAVSTIKSFSMDLFYYNDKTKANDKWNEAKILPYKLLKQLTPCGARYAQSAELIPNGGKHLSYFGGTESILKKIQDSAHQENNIDRFKDKEHIERCVNAGIDLFGRPLQYEKI